MAAARKKLGSRSNVTSMAWPIGIWRRSARSSASSSGRAASITNRELVALLAIGRLQTLAPAKFPPQAGRLDGAHPLAEGLAAAQIALRRLPHGDALQWPEL